MKADYESVFKIKHSVERFEKLLEYMTEEDLAFDCGANVGNVAARFVDLNCAVECFEPDPLAFGLLSERFRGKQNVTLHNVAVGTEERDAQLYFHQSRFRSSNIEMTQSSSVMADKLNIDTERSTPVKVINFIDVLRKQEKPISILKIDIEGSEGVLLDKILDENLENRFLSCFVETHVDKVPSSAPFIQSVRSKIKVRKINHIFLDWK